MTVLDPGGHYKPLDFGADGVTGSVTADGRIIAINAYHPVHGYVTLTAADPFAEGERYNPASVRAYRAGLVDLDGFGYTFEAPVIWREAELLEDVLPRLRLAFADGGRATVTTLAVENGVLQLWDVEGTTPRWTGRVSVQRCAYTQLTEGGPLPPAPIETRARFANGVLTLENPALGHAVALAGLPDSGREWARGARSPLGVRLDGQPGRSILAYGIGATAGEAAARAQELAAMDGAALIEAQRSVWRERWRGIPPDLILRRGLSYSLALAVPVDDTICLLTDHMLLPLSWNRDSYYAARALLSWQPAMADVVRRHLLWMFERAERRAGAWGRCYLATGRIKDGAFQLDQQLFPLLELAEYTLETHEHDTFDRVRPQVNAVREMLLRRRGGSALFSTDETPADDPIALPYSFSSHVLFWRVAMLMARIDPLAQWRALADELRESIDRCFIVPRGDRKLYAYATNSAGQHHFYHDANDVPFALSPAWGIVKASDPVWQATVAFAYGDENVGGAYGGRLGSVHTRAPWPLGDVQAIMIARAQNDPIAEARAWANLRRSAQWDGALPEAADAQTGAVISRHWFAWPNAMLAWINLERGAEGRC